MNKIIFCLIATITTCFFVKKTNAQTGVKIDSILNAYATSDLLSGSYMIVKDGKVILSKGYNYADRGARKTNTQNTAFRIASVTKPFTAASILLLQENGKLSVTDVLNKYIPDYPKGDSITIHHLLAHTSGIKDAYKLPFFTDSVLCSPITLEALIQTFKYLPLDFSPGEKYRYSNSGYILLAYIIEKVSGVSYGTFIQKNIFEPLGMRNSGTKYGSNKKRAVGYTVNENTVTALIPSEDASIGTGSLYSCTEDLYKFFSALFEGKLLSRSSMLQMTTPATKDGYAYGLFTGVKNGHKAIWHSGGIFGFSSFVQFYPDEKLYIIGLRNCDRYALLNEEDILPKICFNESISLPVIYQEIKLETEVLRKYAGEYELSPKAKIKITEKNNSLIMTGPDGVTFTIYPAEERLFFLKVMDVQMEFISDESKKVTGMTWIQRGRKIPARKI